MDKQQDDNYLANLKQALQGKVSDDLIQKFFSYFANKAVFLRSIRSEYKCDLFENYLKENTEIKTLVEIGTISQLLFEFNKKVQAPGDQVPVEPNAPENETSLYQPPQKKIALNQGSIDKVQYLENLKCIEIDFPSVKDDGKIQVMKLIHLLNHPLTEEERFPSSQILEIDYHGLTEKERLQYFREGKAISVDDASLKLAIDYALNPEKISRMSTNTNEQYLISETDNLIEMPLRAFSNTAKLGMSFDRNSVSTTLTSTSKPYQSKSSKETNPRRDFLCYHNNVLVLFGEEKGAGDSKEVLDKKQDECLQQIIQNSGSFNTVYYGCLPFVFSFSSVFNKVTFYVFIRDQSNGSNKEWVELTQFDLFSATDRLKLVFFSLNLARLFYYLSKYRLIPDGNDALRLKLNKPEPRNGCSIMFRINESLKELVFEKKLTDFGKSENLEKLHKLIHDKTIPNTCHIYNIIDDSRLKTRTLQMKVYNEAKYGFVDKKCSILDCLIDITQSLIELHQKQFCHCDIRLENILFDSFSMKFILNDFDSASFFPKDPYAFLTIHQSIKDLNKDNKYEPKHDLYSLGLLIDSVAKKFKKHISPLDDIKSKLFEYKYQNSSELLRDLFKLESKIAKKNRCSNCRQDCEQGCQFKCQSCQVSYCSQKCLNNQPHNICSISPTRSLSRNTQRTKS